MKKALLIIFGIVVITATLLVGCCRSTDPETTESETKTLTATQNNTFSSTENTSIIWKNICKGFINEYFTVSHSTSRNSSINNCRKYLTEDLYEKLKPSEKGTEIPQSIVDVDYSSSVSIKENYFYNDNSLAIQCRVTSTTNGSKSINEYFVICTMKNINNNWLISDYELIAIEGSTY